MEEEVQDVNTESSPVEDVNSDSSTEGLEEATSQEADQSDSEQKVPLERFRTVTSENQHLREQNNLLIQNQQQVQTTQQVEVDPDINATPETKVFYQDMARRNQKQIDAAISKAEVRHKQVVDNLTVQNARIQEKLFRQEQSDVVAGSKEEQEIAQYISMGIPPDKAAMAVMGDKRITTAKSEKVTKQQIKTQQKAQANLESNGIPTNSGMPSGQKLSFRETLDAKMKLAGI